MKDYKDIIGAQIDLPKQINLLYLFIKKIIKITLARKRENFLKSGAGRKLLDNLFQLKTDLSQAEK